jgi:hypothetical protein
LVFPRPEQQNVFAGMVSRSLVSLVLSAAIAVGVGCATSPDGPSPQLRNTAAQSPGTNARVPPSVVGAERGLEVWSWIVADAAPRHGATPMDAPGREPIEDAFSLPPPVFTIIDDRLTIETALGPFLDRPVPLPDSVRFRWHAAGMRLVSVPVSELPRIQSALRIVGPTQRQWLGEAPMWTDLVRGGSAPAREVVTDEGLTRLQAGRLQLFGRAWITPDPDGLRADVLPSAALRLELVPQLQPQLTEPQRLLAAAGRTTVDGIVKGRVFPSLSLGMYLSGGDAIVIVPDAPSRDWSTDDDELMMVDLRQSMQSLGEALLVNPASRGKPRTRAILVLIPHVPEHFELTR